MKPQFVHLRLHTEFSLIDSCIRIDAMIKAAKTQSMCAIAVTDFNNLFSLIKFYKSAQSAGIKPLVGADFLILDPSDVSKPGNLLLLVQNQVGYKNLIELISRGYREGQRHGVPHIEESWLKGKTDGLIALSGAQKGSIGLAINSGRGQTAEEYLQTFMALFPNRFYLELQRVSRPGEEAYIESAIQLALDYRCPVVATNDVCFLHPDEFDTHEARVCIHEGRTLDDPRREKRYSEQQYLRSDAEMSELFEDIPEALKNTYEIARRCSLNLSLGKYSLPEFPVPKGMTTNQYFIQLAEQGLDQRLSDRKLVGKAICSSDEYSKRLKLELKIITEMGFTGYFLIVMDFILWAKNNNIPVGPGRGSGAGSLVAYALKITDLDPIDYDLLFERFLNPERVSLPDFDIDFCMEGRDRVIEYVSERYGRMAVSQIVTFGTMAAKAVVRDAARVLGKSYILGDKMSKMIPFEVGMTLAKAHAQEAVLRDFLENDGEAGEVWALAVGLEGITRNCGKHAGGVVISPTKITDFTPIYCDESGQGSLTQFDKTDVEEAGLVKFDFLGLRTLTIISWAVKMINNDRLLVSEKALNIEDIPLDDEDTFKLMQRGHTTAVFQLESRGMKELIRKLGPDRFEDIIALVALFRPGPLQSGMVDDFINRKKGLAPVSYPHPKYQHDCLKASLEPTYGVILYQEQVMQIAQVMGGYTLGGADLLRRAMGKKDAKKMGEQRSTFIEGALERGFSENLASNIFELMEKFAGYGFNKSHSAAYALIAYQTAWLKVHYPAQFMASTISSDMDTTDKVVSLIDECRAMNLKLLPPDVNISQYQFSVNDKNQILYGLGAIKGLGEGPVNTIIDVRNQGGVFTDIFDFCKRVDPRKLNKRALEALIKAGAMDQIGPSGSPGYSRAGMLASVEAAMKLSQQQAWNDGAGMEDLFGNITSVTASDKNYASNFDVSAFTASECLEGEKETLGLFLTGHPIDEYVEELEKMSIVPISRLKPVNGSCSIAGTLISMRVMKTKKGESFAFLTIDDKTGRIDITLFSEKYNAAKDILIKDSLIIVEGNLSPDDYTGKYKMVADSVKSMYSARCAKLKKLQLNLEGSDNQWVDSIRNILNDYRDGNCSVVIEYTSEKAEAKLFLGSDWMIKPKDELIIKLKNQFGQDSVVMHYD